MSIGVLPYPFYRLPVLKQPFAYTQTTVCLYSNANAKNFKGQQGQHKLQYFNYTPE